ncbi:hypothetical protein KUV57_12425 [Epibacterium sp. DP7N7-1]|nr:hypothetical protein [Epibacterium sp. DP7N7-1]
MIYFRTMMWRNFEVPAWNIVVEALCEPDYDMLNNEDLEKAIYEQAKLTGGKNEQAVMIARLEGLLVRELMIDEPQDLIDQVAEHCGVGRTFDITYGTHVTGESLLQLLSRGGGAQLIFDEDFMENPTDLFVSGNLTADAHVDRGAVLAYMVPHLSALTNGKLLIAHQEPVERQNPKDQRDRLVERLSAIRGILERIGGEVEFAHLGREITGREVRMPANALGEPVPEHADLPMILMTGSPDDFDSDDYYLFDSDSYEVIEFGDWAEARFGSRPQPDEDFAFG